MVEVLDQPRVAVNGREVPAEAIAAEAQHHPAPDAQAAWNAAAEALAVRQLLLDEAERLGIEGSGRADADGRPLCGEEARIEALLAAEVQTPRADEATARRYYDTHRERFRSAPLVEASHILFAADPADSLAYGLATGDARTAIRTLQRDPQAFDLLARQHSACPSKEQGGMLGQIAPGALVPEFEEVLFSLEPGALHPEPVRTRFGVHVIRAGRHEEARELPFEAVSDQISGYLEEASWRRAVAQYIGILAAGATLEGVELAAATGPLVQ
ncbi:MAG: peptidyl-prolyl cis-trans isomerase [Sphingomonadales bacterium]|nr:peptidyl-prolyl cis-trans isomerase [Sphingomonadales bacterium]MDE2171274.1 peptidyl-prolyl cis-trans isomerase [Sphingomonadales bacterium]